MKELLAGFATEIFRPVVTLLIPGFWALTPWTIGIFLRYQVDWKFACDHRDGSGLVFVVAATALGMVFENLGARLEELFFKLQKNDHSNWYAYLTLAPEREPIGLRYIRTLVLRMKFELSMGLAGIVVLLGIVYIPISCHLKSVFGGISLALTLYFLFESWSSVSLLEKTRVEILNRIAPLSETSTDARDELNTAIVSRSGGTN
jgi:hypothetical protein